MVGTQVGDYRVLELLGVGGMGEVYRGVHTSLGRVVALKVLSAAADVSASNQRFHNEARIHAAIRHPHIAALFEHVQCNGRSCLVMEYVDGETLSSILKNQGPLPQGQALKYVHEIAQALGYLHQHDIVHRDIKAGNVKIDGQGQAKLLDFGIARSASSPRLTQAGNIIGTMEYMAPEQLCGEPASPQSDLWALGVLLYEILTGKMPFVAADLPSLHHKITRVGYSRASLENPQVSREVDGVIARCLQKSPSARYHDAAEMASDLQKLLDNSSEPEPHRAAVPTNTPFQKNTAWLAGAGVFALVAVCGVMLFGGRKSVSTVPLPDKEVPTISSGRQSDGVEPQGTSDKATRPVKIDVTVGQAEIYRNGELLGKTPYTLDERLGQDVNLTLKQPGYEDQAVQFTITERKRYYSFLMEKE